jgi:hypothetical protein
VALAEVLELEPPLVELLAARAERLLEIRVGPGNEAVERRRDLGIDLN